jgi:uncharacterized membrane protein
VLPRLEHGWVGQLASMSSTSAIAIYSTAATGTMTLSAIVFSLTFVMVQFSATAYSPRLALWMTDDPLISHALGVFTATFLYSIAALAWVDRNGVNGVPLISAAVVILFLLASIASFIALIKRVTVLQVRRMLAFTGDRGRRVIETVYVDPRWGASEDGYPPPSGAATQVVRHAGRPQTIQTIDNKTLLRLATDADARIDVAVAVGDTVMESTPLLRVFGTDDIIDEERLLAAIRLGEQRTFDQDPQFAIRLLVDIAIRALSPAINDPTTAVQALDEIGDLLLRLGRSCLATSPLRDGNGAVRVIIPLPTWEDFLKLAFEEISMYGATSVQVLRRMNALVSELMHAVPPERRTALGYWRRRLRSTVDRSFADLDVRRDASEGDRQGLGVSRPDAA